jgi:hypothetical protein
VAEGYTATSTGALFKFPEFLGSTLNNLCCLEITIKQLENQSCKPISELFNDFKQETIESSDKEYTYAHDVLWI